jgi:hypothetical protein
VKMRHIVVVDSVGEFLSEIEIELPIPIRTPIKYCSGIIYATYNVPLDVYKVTKPICAYCGVAPCRTPGACNSEAAYEQNA